MVKKEDRGPEERRQRPVGRRAVACERQHSTKVCARREIPVWWRLMPREYQFPFELRHLVYFREVARQLHFRQAAETLAVAQPALSRQIAQLEKAVGAPLFLRTRRRVEL